ncbi:MAG: MFS transporter [Phycisphaerae bacterium]
MTASTPKHPGARWDLLRNRDFILLWCAYGVSAMGDHLSEMAILKQQNAASPGVAVTQIDARMTFVFFVPFFLISPLTGWLADRLPRRGLMITADLVRCMVMFFFATLMMWAAPLGQWGPVTPLLLVGLFAAMFSPARSALLPTLVRQNQLVRANGMISGLGVIATMVAIMIGGILIDKYQNPEAVFRIDAATYLTSAILLWFLNAPPQPAAGNQTHGVVHTIRDLAAGFRYAWCHRRVLELLAIAALVWFCGPLVKCVIPAIVRDAYGYVDSYQAISTYRAFLGVGFILGALTISTLGGALKSEIAITWGLFGVALGIAVFAASVFLPVANFTRAVIGVVGVVLTGTFGIAVLVSFNTLLQRIVPDRCRGRVFGIKDLCATGSLLLATGLLGVPQNTPIDPYVGHILLVVAFAMFTAGWITLRVRLRRSFLTTPLTLAQHVNDLLVRFWWRFERVGPCTIPRTGPVIVTANHTCYADPLLLSAGMYYRTMAFMVAAEYTNWPVIRTFMRLIECIPVRRGTRDTSATKQAMRLLRDGKAVAIFIEGGIVPPGKEARPKDGVAMLALKTKAPVIPAHISGTFYRERIVAGLLVRHRARLRFGKPVDLSEFTGDKSNRETVRAATAKIYAAIQSLAPRSAEPDSSPPGPEQEHRDDQTFDGPPSRSHGATE